MNILDIVLGKNKNQSVYTDEIVKDPVKMTQTFCSSINLISKNQSFDNLIF